MHTACSNAPSLPQSAPPSPFPASIQAQALGYFALPPNFTPTKYSVLVRSTRRKAPMLIYSPRTCIPLFFWKLFWSAKTRVVVGEGDWWVALPLECTYDSQTNRSGSEFPSSNCLPAILPYQTGINAILQPNKGCTSEELQSYGPPASHTLELVPKCRQGMLQCKRHATRRAPSQTYRKWQVPNFRVVLLRRGGSHSCLLSSVPCNEVIQSWLNTQIFRTQSASVSSDLHLKQPQTAPGGSTDVGSMGPSVS